MSYDEDDFYYDDFAQSHAPEAEEFVCDECDGSYYAFQQRADNLCNECRGYDEDDDFLDHEPAFADPGGTSALRAATPGNPRNLPCPTCHGENLLTPADVARGYQCDGCADALERGY